MKGRINNYTIINLMHQIGTKLRDYVPNELEYRKAYDTLLNISRKKLLLILKEGSEEEVKRQFEELNRDYVKIEKIINAYEGKKNMISGIDGFGGKAKEKLIAKLTNLSDEDREILIKRLEKICKP